MAWPFSGVVAPNFDSDVVAVPAVATNIPNSTNAACWLLGLHVSNPTAGAITLTLTDNSGNQIIPPVIVPQKDFVSITWQFMPSHGIMQWAASSVGLLGRVWGYI